MSFQAMFVALVVFLAIAPKQFSGLLHWAIESLMPLISRGLTLALVAVGLMIIVGRFK